MGFSEWAITYIISLAQECDREGETAKYSNVKRLIWMT